MFRERSNYHSEVASALQLKAEIRRVRDQLPKLISLLPNLGTNINPEQLAPNRAHKIDLIGVPGGGKSSIKTLDWLYYGFKNLLFCVEPYWLAQKVQAMHELDIGYMDGITYTGSPVMDMEFFLFYPELLINNVKNFPKPIKHGDFTTIIDLLDQVTLSTVLTAIYKKHLEQYHGSGLVVCDRSEFDLALHFATGLMATGVLPISEYVKWQQMLDDGGMSEWLVPSMTFIFLNDPDKIKARKNVENVSNRILGRRPLEILNATYLHAYNLLTTQGHKNVVLIDASRSFEEVSSDIVNHILAVAGDVLIPSELDIDQLLH